MSSNKWTNSGSVVVHEPVDLGAEHDSGPHVVVIAEAHAVLGRHAPELITNIGEMEPIPMPSQEDFEKMLAGEG